MKKYELRKYNCFLIVFLILTHIIFVDVSLSGVQDISAEAGVPNGTEFYDADEREAQYSHGLADNPDNIAAVYDMNNSGIITFSAFYNQNRGIILSSAFGLITIVSLSLGSAVYFLKKSRESIWKMAYIDPLTGIGNINKFRIDAEYLIKNNPNTKYMIEKLDIERLPYINEIYGNGEGDLVLQDLAKSIEFVIDKNKDAFARIGSEEFIILKSYKSLEQMEITRILYENKFFEIHGKNKSPLIKFRIGRYILEPGEFDLTKIFEKVNHAHKLAKQQKGHMFCCYDESVKSEANYSREIESKMENALQEQNFIVYLQPKYFLSDNSIIGAEALVRWEYNGKELVYPNSFISLFEQNGFIMKLDNYMVERVCEIMKSWIIADIEPVAISINFSRLHLLDHISFLRELCEIVDKYNIPRKYIEIEFTESVLFDNEEILTDILIKLNNEGFSISLDDFGTGNYSLSALKNIPIDVIRINNSFFADSNDPQKSEIVTSFVMLMAKNLDISTVAERVETPEQIDMLKKVGCDIAQGYFYSKPVCVDDFTQQLKTRTKNNSKIK